MKARPRLGFYMYAPAVGGAERYLRDLLAGLAAADFDITVLYFGWPGFTAFLGGVPGIATVPVPAFELGAAHTPPDTPHPPSGNGGYGAQSPRTALRRATDALPATRKAAFAVRGALRLPYVAYNRRRLRNAVRAARLDLLHVVNGGYPAATSAQAAILAAADVGVPRRIMTVCSTATARRHPRRFEAFVDRQVDAACDAFILPGAVPAAALRERHQLGSEIHLIPWGVAPPSRPVERSTAREALGLGETALVIGTLGRLVPGKGNDVLLQAYLILRNELPTLRLVIGGDGPERETLETKARLSGADVHFVPAVSDAFSFCRALDVFVLASDLEGLPYVVLEAMSQERAIVATDVGAMGDAVKRGYNGALVAPRDPGALAAALRPILLDRALRQRLGQSSLARFESRFRVSRMIDAHVALYRNLMAAA